MVSECQCFIFSREHIFSKIPTYYKGVCLFFKSKCDFFLYLMISHSWCKMSTSNQHNNVKFVILLFCDAEIFSTFSGKLLRFPGNSLFLSSFWNVWLFLNFISPFISLEKTVLSSYFDTKWVHLIYIIRNVFQPKKVHTSGSNLQFGISFHVLVMSFTGMFLQNSASLRSSLKNQENWRHWRGDDYRAGRASSGWQHSALWTQPRLHGFCAWSVIWLSFMNWTYL